MSKKLQYLFVCFFMLSIACAQKTIEKKWIGLKGIEEVQINADKIFQLKITNSKTDGLAIQTAIEGEYHSGLNITTETKDGILFIGCDLKKDFQIPNDKLSAHKVFSVTLEIQIPKQLKVQLKGEETLVAISGTYQRFFGLLISGSYTISNFIADARLQTKKGNIHYIDPVAIHLSRKQKEIFIYKEGKKIELKADNGKITYSSKKA